MIDIYIILLLFAGLGFISLSFAVENGKGNADVICDAILGCLIMAMVLVWVLR